MNSFLLSLLFIIHSDFSFKERLSISTEYDSNIYRSTYNTNEKIISDFDLRLQSDFYFRFSKDKNIINTNLMNGAKLFINNPDADTIVNQADISYIYKMRILTPEIGTEIKDISSINTIQDYTILRPYFNLNFKINGFFLKLATGFETFIFDFNDNYSYEAPLTGFLTMLKIDDNLNLNINYIFKYEFFDSYAYKKAGNLDSDSLLTEKTQKKTADTNHNILLRLNYESDILLSLSYNPEINISNSIGESVFRQRFQLSVASQIFLDIYINILLSFMVSSFKDGILISDQILLINDNENRNYVIIKLSREIVKNLMLEIKYSYFYSEFSNYTTSFSRYTIASGLCLRF